MEPIVTGSLIGAGSSLLGGAIGGHDARAAMRKQIAAQKEFAQHGIRWRVEDAKRAGLHPLYALGAQTPSFSPVHIDDSMGPAISEAGQNIGRAVAATLTPEEKLARNLNLKILEKQLEESDARIGVLRSEEALNLSQQGPGGLSMTGWARQNMLEELGGAGGTSMSARMVNEALAERTLPGVTQVVPTQTPTVSSKGPHLMAGPLPAMREYKLAPGLDMTLPGTPQGDASDAWENATENYIAFLGLIGMNIKERGWGWFDKFMNHWTGGISPAETTNTPIGVPGKRYPGVRPGIDTR